MRFYGNVIDGGGDSVPQSVKQTASKVVGVTPSVLAAKESGSIGAASIAAQVKAAEKAAAEKAATDAKAAATAKKLADMKSAREAELAEKSRVRREAAGLPANTGFWADRTGTSSTVPSSTGQTSTSSSFTTSTYTSPAPTPTPATPATVAPVVQAPPAPPVKTAPIDTVLFNDDDVLPELMEKLIFENIGGHELINIARNDIVNGQTISYQPIKNLSSLQQQYNPNNILSLQATSDKYFANFAIKLENKIPNVASGPSGSGAYIDPLTGSLVVDVIGMESDEQVEIEITLSGTIYEADLNGSES
jgi:hypothetical protein